MSGDARSERPRRAALLIAIGAASGCGSSSAPRSSSSAAFSSCIRCTATRTPAISTRPPSISPASRGRSIPLVLITSSLTAALAVHELRERQDRRTLEALHRGTILLALTFLVVKGFEWAAKFEHGLYPNAAHLLSLPKGQILYFGLYFTMTGPPRDPRHRRDGHLRLLPALHLPGLTASPIGRSSPRTRPSSGTSST
jgi:hypothetical protein